MLTTSSRRPTVVPAELPFTAKAVIKQPSVTIMYFKKIVAFVGPNHFPIVDLFAALGNWKGDRLANCMARTLARLRQFVEPCLKRTEMGGRRRQLGERRFADGRVALQVTGNLGRVSAILWVFLLLKLTWERLHIFVTKIVPPRTKSSTSVVG